MSFDRDFQHRTALISAAIAEFSEHGYDRASINRILKSAGMSKGQFYHHFEGKEALYFGLVADLITRKKAYFAANPVPDQDDFFQSLRGQLRAGLAFSRANPEVDQFSRSFLRERGRPIFHRTLTHFTFDEGSSVAQLVRRSHAVGAFGAGMSLEFVQRLVAMVFNGAAGLLEADAPEEVESRLEQLVQFLRGGLENDR